MWDDSEIIMDANLFNTDGNIIEKRGSGVKFTRTSDHMDEGFPGKLKVEASFIVTSDHELHFNWKAWLVEGQDATTQTPISLANHTMWNLSGDFVDSTIHNHTLRLPNCSKTL